MKKGINYILLGLFFLVLGGCEQTHVPPNPSPLTKEELNFYQMWKMWNAQNIKNYSFSVKRNCFCPPEEKINIVVKNNRVISSEFIPSHKALPMERQKRLMTIDDYFKKIDSAFKERYAYVGLKFNKRYSFPEEIFFDYSKDMADDEIGYHLSDFKVIEKKREEISYCNEEYKPVCAKVQVQCVTSPCPSYEKTFSNRCHLGKNKLATFLHEGRCK